MERLLQDDSSATTKVTVAQVRTIAGTVEVLTLGGKKFFRKRDLNQFYQLKYASAHGIPVPEVRLLANDGLFEMEDAGTELSKVAVSSVAEDNQLHSRIIYAAGKCLSSVHQMLNSNGGEFPAEICNNDPINTANILRSFKHRFLSTGSHSTRTFLAHTASQLPQELRSLGELMHVVIDNYRGIVRNLCEADFSTEIIWGDYKPENILISNCADGESRIQLIDPVITRGIRGMDLAKFIGRFHLDLYPIVPTELLAEFFKGYFSETGFKSLVPPVLEFEELVLLDLVNILASYFGNYLNNQRTYRLVDALNDPSFVRYTEQLLSHYMVRMD